MTSKNFTEETLISLKRVAGIKISPDKEKILILISEVHIKENNASRELYIMNTDGTEMKLISTEKIAEPTFIGKGDKIAFLQKGEIYIMNTDGSSKKKISSAGKANKDIGCFLFSENLKKLLVVKSIIPKNPIVQKGCEKYKDCENASNCYIAEDLCYNHWDSLQDTISHPFVYDIEYDEKEDDIIINEESEKDFLEKYDFECPSSPFGGIDDFDMNKDGSKIYFLCRRFTGREYVYSTNVDLFEYTCGKNEVLNIGKGVYESLDNFAVNIYEGINFDISFKEQQNKIQENVIKIYGEKTFYKNDVKKNKIEMNLGYNASPKLSPDNKMICWSSLERDGYESDIARLFIFNFETKEKFCITEGFETQIKSFTWGLDNKTIYFVATYEGTNSIFKTDIIDKKVEEVISEMCDFSNINILNEDQLIVGKYSMNEPKEVYQITLSNKKVKPLTFFNKEKLEGIPICKIEKRMVETFDKKQMLCWVSYPPDFNPEKKYPTLLYCQGGPQDPVSQFWSYRWNFRLMSSKGYIVISPNRRGVPGFGREWLEEISGDYYNYCMKDYLSAIDNISKEKYVNKEKLGAVGPSFGGYSVYWLAGNHEKRFKAFVCHSGIFNLEQFYFETEEMWFALWDNETAPWNLTRGIKELNYSHSPHLFVNKWDTPILVIHGTRDYRILHSQGESAFQAARKRNIPARLLIFTDEGHLVARPQNSLIWFREFFSWLDKWLK